MDVAAMSVVMANQQARADASMAVMNQVKGLLHQQGEQLVDMLQQSGTEVPHPTLGQTIDIKL